MEENIVLYSIYNCFECCSYCCFKCCETTHDCYDVLSIFGYSAIKSSFGKNITIPKNITHLIINEHIMYVDCGCCIFSSNIIINSTYSNKHEALINSDYINDENSLILHKNMTHITFTYIICDIDMTHVTHLTFVCIYLNQNIKIPCHITHLTYKYCSMKKIKLTNNITYLELECNDGKKIIKIPQNITKLNLWYVKKIILPQKLTHLFLSFDKFEKIKIPFNVTHFYLNNNGGGCCIKISYRITHLTLYNHKIKIPNNTTHLTFNDNLNKNNKIKIPQSVIHLNFNGNVYCKIKIPQNVTHLNFNCGVYCKIKIPQSVTHLTFKHYFNNKIKIPQNVIHLL